MAIRAQLTTVAANSKPSQANAAGASTEKREISEEEKATRKERVAKAKDALARSVAIKGEHVAPARAALKTYLQKLNLGNQPDDAAFESLLEAPFRAPERKKVGNNMGGGGGGRR